MGWTDLEDEWEDELEDEWEDEWEDESGEQSELYLRISPDIVHHRIDYPVGHRGSDQSKF